MAKKFLYVCAGLFLLALTYHLGARSAVAQAGGQVVGVAAAFAQNTLTEDVFVTTSSGDVYRKQAQGPWQFQGNALGAGPTPAQSATWGQVKSTYRK